MTSHLPHKPHHSHNESPAEPEPGLHPVEPDEGPVPPAIPLDDDGQIGTAEV
ncbi:MAG: hypothetical protein ABI564_09080 [Ideonella sp.]